MKLKSAALIAGIALSGCKTHQEVKYSTRAQIPHEVLSDKCDSKVAREIKFKNYIDLKNGLEIVNVSGSGSKFQVAAELYNMTIYKMSFQETLGYIEKIKSEHLQGNYAYPLIAVLGSIELTNSSRENEIVLIDKINEMINQFPAYRNQLILSLGQRSKVDSVRKHVQSALRNILQDSSYEQSVTNTAGATLVLSYLNIVGKSVLKVAVPANYPASEKINYQNCVQAAQISSFANAMIVFLSKNSSIPKKQIESIMREDFIVILMSQSRNRSAGSFGGDALLVNNDYDAPWVSAHETVHGISYHLRMRSVGRDIKAYIKKYAHYSGNPYIMDEMVSQMIVNEVIADLIHVPLKAVCGFVQGYKHVIEQPKFQAIYERMIERTGSRRKFFNTFFQCSRQEKNRLFQNAIIDLYGRAGLAAIMALDHTSDSSIRSVLEALKENPKL